MERNREEIFKEYQRWLHDANPEIVKELGRFTEDQIIDSFFKDLEFGTGGMRGIIGAGTNRINIHTVARATQGFSNWLNKNYSTPSVVIAYDTRRMSREFAQTAAKVLSANNIKTYLFTEPTPTPVLSFAVRELKCSGGIVITASHNPPEYNGFKVYTHDGTQAVPRYAKAITEEVDKVDFFVELVGNEEFIEEVPQSVMDSFQDHIIRLISELLEIHACEPGALRVLYTPLHGTGFKPVVMVLEKLGFKVDVIQEQCMPDGNFPTVNYPNPEDPEAFNLALKRPEVNADIIIATDPDCDRMGLMCRCEDGYTSITGNQMGVIMLEFLLETLKDRLPNDTFVVKTIVTTDLAKAIAKRYDVEIKETLTGFKFIGELIEKSAVEGSGTFLFGFEESYGYLYGTHARDKDAVVASALAATVAASLKKEGVTLIDFLKSIYEKYGYYIEDLKNFTFKGIKGAKKITRIMEMLRNATPKEVAGRKLLDFKDYREGLAGLPPSNVIEMVYEDELKLIARPSGTEPKIKFYLMTRDTSEENAKAKLELLKKHVERIVES
ncbi:phospho-sugar mutase [Kosmotoga pacifica]|uniref:Glucose-1,6-bisphosphate synthase n=1 Tax=Kosmotoga pacifica TaxID=1330330 RepID=A0A0G2Z8H6_9BACT|nr:phospho-sugar mutase [Kosmotoga pacifica]AKI97872.1 glucose-1,6-bisphosphate synthase [Kosmotoga pacifica]